MSGKMLQIPAGAGENLNVYHSAPDSGGRHPAIVLIHEIWGLEKQIKSVADRLSEHGYAVFAPHLYSRKEFEVLTAENIEKAMKPLFSLPENKRSDEASIMNLYNNLPENEKAIVMKVVSQIFMNREKMEQNMMSDLSILVDYAGKLDYIDRKKIASMGFCMGGGLSFQLAATGKVPSAVVFYGANPKPVESVANISGSVLGLYAGNDPRTNSGLPALVENMVKYGKDFELKVYRGCSHAFFNDLRPTYNKEAAADSWDRVLRFLDKNIKR